MLHADKVSCTIVRGQIKHWMGLHSEAMQSCKMCWLYNVLTCHALVSINYGLWYWEHDESAHLTGFNRLECAGELATQCYSSLIPRPSPAPFSWLYTWPLNRLEKQEKAWYIFYIIKPQVDSIMTYVDSIMTYVDSVSVIMINPYILYWAVVSTNEWLPFAPQITTTQ